MTTIDYRTSLVQKVMRSYPLATQWRIYQAILLLSDTILVLLSIGLAYFIRFGLDLSIFNTTEPPFPHLYRQLVIPILVAWIVLFWIGGAYSKDKLLGGFQEYAAIFRASVYGVLVIVVGGFALSEFAFARAWLLLMFALPFALVTVGRFWLRRGVYALRLRGYFLTPTLLVGFNQEAETMVEQLQEWKTSGLHLIGYLADGETAGSVPRLGGFCDLEAVLNQYEISQLVLVSSALGREQIADIYTGVGLRPDVDVHLTSGLYEVITTGLAVKQFGHVPLVRVNRVQLTGLDLVLKTAVDMLVGGLALLILSPLFIALALVVKLTSQGPAIYRRRVVGLNGREFDAFKFRTMVVNGEEVLAGCPEKRRELEETHKIKDDPRVTRIGHLLRKTSLDELPQLFNVLKREMSLVGPRMITLKEVDMYGDLGSNLLTVRPGITGLWQVSGRSDVSYEERVRLDMSYIRNWSIWLDLQILFQTIPAVLKSRGAY